MLNNLDSPTFVTSWPGNSDVLVVAERGAGIVSATNLSGGGLNQWIVLNLSSKAHIPTDANSDFVGVTGLAFHPDFLTNRHKRFLYVRYNEPVPTTTVVERYEIPPGTLTVDVTTARTIYTYPTIETTHASGQIHFDTVVANPSVRLLYLAMPDDTFASGSCAEKERVQDPSSDLGKVFGIDVEAMPPPPALPPIQLVATGLRNPFGFSVDPGDSSGSGKGDVWIGNTGQQCSGDIFRWIPGTAGVPNYAWPWQVGTCTLADGAQPAWTAGPCTEPTPPPTYTLPDRVVSNGLTGGSHDALLGGYVYRSTTVSTLTNRYVYGLFGSSSSPKILSIAAADPGSGVTTDHSLTLGMSSWGTGNLHGLGQDVDGELYVIRVTSGGPLNNGKIYKIVP